MAWTSIALSGVVAIVLVIGRVWLHKLRTGRSPFRRGTGVSGYAAPLLVGVIFVAGPIAEVGFGATRLFHQSYVSGVGIATSAAALVGLVWAQSTMGASLRIGVDPTERTELVTSGPFGSVRNPIYSFMVTYAAGVALAVPNVISLIAVVVLAVGVELQVRLVEEPYLVSAHADTYKQYATDVGRFVPKLGRLA